jgi:hypothetical protein
VTRRLGLGTLGGVLAGLGPTQLSAKRRAAGGPLRNMGRPRWTDVTAIPVSTPLIYSPNQTQTGEEKQPRPPQEFARWLAEHSVGIAAREVA